jgi:hypothetical protein
VLVVVKALLAMGAIIAVAIGLTLPAPVIHHGSELYMHPGVYSE